MASQSANDAILARYPEIFASSARRQRTGWLIGLGTIAYLAFAWWFFSIGSVLGGANWGIAGTYLNDWYSYEIKPDIDFEENHLTVSFPRFSPLGSDPKPEWLELRKDTVRVASGTGSAATGTGQTANSGFFGNLQAEPAPSPAQNSFMGNLPQTSGEAAAVSAPQAPRQIEAVVEARVHLSADQFIDVQPGGVVVTRGEEVLNIRIEEGRVLPLEPLPDWASQRSEGAKILLSFGMKGRAEIRDNKVKVSRRFLGWENFFFDTRSPFWGKSAGEVISLIAFRPRIEPERSNAALALDNFANNAEWQHGDVWLKLLQTIVMAFVGTVLAVIVAFPLSFLAARNIHPRRVANFALKRFFDFLRCVDMLIWALFFTRAFGPGPLAGISAIFFTDTGTFGKLYSEALENIDEKQREGVRSVGASPSVVQRFGVLPQVLPVFLSQALYFWESNTRSATIIGAVGAGGIGLKLWEAMRTNQDWENVAYMVLLILMVVFIFDNISSMLRRRLIGTEGAALN